MSTIVASSQADASAANGAASREPSEPPANETIAGHLTTSLLYTVLSVIVLGGLYPLLITVLGTLLFPHQAAGSLSVRNGAPVGSELVGQSFNQPRYFAGRPSAAGKNGYDPTATGGTNLGPTSKKLIDATKATIGAAVNANPQAAGAPPMDLVTSSGSGIDPDISPESAYYQAPRVARARGIPLGRVRGLIAAHSEGRTLGFLGEPRVNVLGLNRALDTLAVDAR